MTKQEFKEAMRELAAELAGFVILNALLFSAVWWLYNHFTVAMFNATLSFLSSAFGYLAVAVGVALGVAFIVSLPFVFFRQLIPQFRSKNAPALTREESLVGQILAYSFLAVLAASGVWWFIH
ncbi:hypothetical protein [Rhodoblastus sp.]|jgi:uncharacterized membrane protein|uniref:hypothetical protein n=1 Tax=Rhodoblastus sp. TaxID=1962975 RepID=UPI0025CC2CC7|nr:hypothetical protein [Rhodoblastus sp.]